MIVEGGGARTCTRPTPATRLRSAHSLPTRRVRATCGSWSPRPERTVPVPLGLSDRRLGCSVRGKRAGNVPGLPGGRRLAPRRSVPGSIVTLSSQMGSVGYPGRAAYCATKHAVEGLTKALAVGSARAGVRVNAVAPTFVETPMTVAFLADPEFRAEVLECRLPTQRFAGVEEVARAVHFLAGDAAPSVTGHILKVDSGWTAS